VTPRAVIGIDNGALSGAMCALCPESGALLGYALMPKRNHRGKEEADPARLVQWLSGFECVIVGIEEPLKFASSSQSMRSMALSFGLCHGALELAGLNVARLEVKQWQDTMLGKKVPAGHTKSVALTKAGELWPDEKWHATPRSYTPHNGLIDAALIARYLVGWRQNKNN
jgi:hypothetical protein